MSEATRNDVEDRTKWKIIVSRDPVGNEEGKKGVDGCNRVIFIARSKWYANKRGKIEYNITSATKRKERSENAWNIEKGNIEIRWELDQSLWSSKKLVIGRHCYVKA